MTVTYESIRCDKCGEELEQKEGILTCSVCGRRSELQAVITSRMICKCSGKGNEMTREKGNTADVDEVYTCQLCGNVITVKW